MVSKNVKTSKYVNVNGWVTLICLNLTFLVEMRLCDSMEVYDSNQMFELLV